MIPPDYLPIAGEDRLDAATFKELADLAERSLDAAASGMRTTLLNFVAAGAALEQMRDRMPGDYTRWLAENEIPRSTAGRMIRLHVSSGRVVGAAPRRDVSSRRRSTG